jgi:hypothetical protein
MQQYLSHRQSRSGLSHWEQTTVFAGLISQNISDPALNLKPDFLPRFPAPNLLAASSIALQVDDIREESLARCQQN